VSIRATNFVRGLRGLSPTEKAVAFVAADHAHHKTGAITISMTTLAEESGFTFRQNVNQVMKRLVERKVFLTPKPSKGRTSTVYFVNYELPQNNRMPETAVTEVAGIQLDLHQPKSHATPTAGKVGPTEVSTEVAGIQEGFKGKERKGRSLRSLTRGVCSSEKTKSKTKTNLRKRRKEVIAHFGDEVYLALLLSEAQMGILLNEEQINRVLERLTQLKACGENPVAVIPEVLRQVTTARTANGHGRNGNHLGDSTSSSAPLEHPELGSQEFVAFCAAYPPTKLDRKEALRAWVNGLCDDKLAEVLAGLEDWKKGEQWRRQRGQFIPFASQFLMKERWKNAPRIELSARPEFPRFEVESWARK
jgi:hypothetical protein